MARQYFLPRKEADKLLWLRNFANKLPFYADKYSISSTDVADVQQGTAAVIYWQQYHDLYEKHLKKLTAYKKELRDGTPSAAASTPPVPPVIDGPHVLAAPGIFARATSIANVIKSRIIYTEADGHDLGIVGIEKKTDIQNMKPSISLRLIAGGHPEVVWSKNGMDGVEIYKDDGSGNWLLLAYDAHPNFPDHAPLPPAGHSAVWKYKCIYRQDDKQAGKWSDETSITVMGM